MPKIATICLAILTLSCVKTQVSYALATTTNSTHNINSINITSAKDLWKYKDVLTELMSPYVKISVYEIPPNCVQMQCQFVCLNGKWNEIEDDINEVAKKTPDIKCAVLEELRLYNYEFPGGKIPLGFLGGYAKKVQSLYIAKSPVSSVEGGAFGNGIFKAIILEDLQLRTLEKDFFKDINADFYKLSIVQRESPPQSIYRNFLDHVNQQLRHLTLQVGIECVRNVTAADNSLHSLTQVDLSYNHFRDELNASTFSKLSMVELMDLSHSEIWNLPAYIFADFATTLKYLDISHNHLLTLGQAIFGWQPVAPDLRIVATYNPWECTCVFSMELKEIFTQRPTELYCYRPESVSGWSVFDERLCAQHTGTTNGDPMEISFRPDFTAGPFKSTTFKQTGNSREPENAGGGADDDSMILPATTPAPPLDYYMQLQCDASSIADRLTVPFVRKPTLKFSVAKAAGLSVDVTVENDDTSDDAYGLLWFSEVSRSKYYERSLNLNEYGLGCYDTLTQSITVQDLLPDVAYVFCTVLKGQTTVSPFNCKSIHVNSMLEVSYTAWLTRDMRTTGISLTVFGIVMFTFAGLLLVFVLLKSKPTLLKGSKRVATSKASTGEIIVFPKDKTLEDFKLKEEMLAKRNSRCTTIVPNRRGSHESLDSNQSYMNTNLYEVIPAYLKLDEVNASINNLPFYSISDEHSNYLPPLGLRDYSDMELDDVDYADYAEVSPRTKRTSNDPLPEVPKDEAPFAIALAEENTQLSTTSIGEVIMFDCQV